MVCRLHCLIELARADELRAELDQANTVVEAAAIGYFEWLIQMMRDLVDILTDAPGIDDRLVATYELGSANNADADASLGAGTLCLARCRGSVADLAPFIQIQVETMPQFPAWQSVHALSLAEAGEVERARQLFDGLWRDGFPRNFTWVAATMCLAELAARLEEAEPARAIYDRLSFASGRLDSLAGVASLGPVDLSLAHAARCFGDEELAQRHAEIAADVAQRFRSAPFLAMGG